MAINPSLWDFPVQIQLKVIGASKADLEQIITTIMQHHHIAMPQDYDQNSCGSRPSSGGKYRCVTVPVMLRNKEQVEGIYRALNEHPQVLKSL